MSADIECSICYERVSDGDATEEGAEGLVGM